MKLLFIFTGGTIGSALSGDFITPDKDTAYKLIEIYKKRYGFNHDYDTLLPYTELSEQNTGETITKLVKCVEGNIGKYDGIIVTHGTDTLPFSAAALSYALGNACVPVCIVSSNYPLDGDRANGVDNLYGAIKLIEESVSFAGDCKNSSTRDSDRAYKHCGVFVPYRNHDGVIYIHRASRLIETMPYSDEYFSVNNNFYGRIMDGEVVVNENFVEKADELKPFSDIKLSEMSKGILRIRPYPGMVYPTDLSAVQVIVHDSFHSGTINTNLKQYREFFKKAADNNISVFLTGTTDGVPYDSTEIFKELNIKTINNISPVAAYMKAWMLIAAKKQCDVNAMNASLGGDVVI